MHFLYYFSLFYVLVLSSCFFLQPVVQEKLLRKTELAEAGASYNFTLEDIATAMRKTRPLSSTVSNGMKLMEVKFYCFIIVGERARVVELKKRNEK